MKPPESSENQPHDDGLPERKTVATRLATPGAVPMLAGAMIAVFGTWCLIWAGIVVALGRVEMNRRNLTRANEPREFMMVVVAAVVGGCACLAVTGLCFWYGVRRSAHAHDGGDSSGSNNTG